MNEETEIPPEIPKEKKRARKKQLYSSIKDLMEFYFSAANLSKDRWLKQSLDESGSISLSHFLSFNKIRALTNNINDIVMALRNSEILEVSEDYKVRRVTPLEFKDNTDDCIIYVEQIPSDADHEWVKSFFTCYGPIDYISLPKFSNTKKCKGFAFIEFSNSESAEKALEEYKKAGHYLSNNIEPQELLSISTFEKKNTQPTNLLRDISSDQVESEPNETINKKRKQIEIIEGENTDVADAVAPKRIKLGEEEEDCKEHANFQTHLVQSNHPEGEDLNLEECSEGLEGNTDELKKKKNRKKKKKTKKNKITPEATGFQILSKKDWKALRNKYLNIQKEKMKQLKNHLRQTEMKSDYPKQWREPKKSKMNMKDDISEQTTISKDFVPGAIVKIEMSEPAVNLKEFRSEVKSKNDDVKYIDVKEGSFCAYIRLATSEAATDFCEKSVWNNAEILKGDEETGYWEKVEKERQDKLSKQNQKVKKRGREKMFKKAEKLLGKHITFEDAE